MQKAYLTLTTKVLREKAIKKAAAIAIERAKNAALSMMVEQICEKVFDTL